MGLRLEDLDLEPRTYNCLSRARGRIPFGDRKIWVAFQVSDAMVNSGMFGVPAAMRQFLEGDFRLIAADDDPVGMLAIRENGAWGLSPFFRRRGVESGDYLALEFDLITRSATAEVGEPRW